MRFSKIPEYSIHLELEEPFFHESWSRVFEMYQSSNYYVLCSRHIILASLVRFHPMCVTTGRTAAASGIL